MTDFFSELTEHVYMTALFRKKKVLLESSFLQSIGYQHADPLSTRSVANDHFVDSFTTPESHPYLSRPVQLLQSGYAIPRSRGKKIKNGSYPVVEIFMSLRCTVHICIELRKSLL